MRKYSSLIQAILFYAVWYYVVLKESSPNNDLYVFSAQLIFCLISIFIYNGKKIKFTFFIILTAIIGTIIDTIPAYFGFVESPNSEYKIFIYPAWLIGMWFCFASAIPISLGWMSNRRLLQITFGAVGGPLSLFAAYNIGAVILPMPFTNTAIIYALEWAIVVPVGFLIANKFRILAPNLHQDPHSSNG